MQKKSSFPFFLSDTIKTVMEIFISHCLLILLVGYESDSPSINFLTFSKRKDLGSNREQMGFVKPRLTIQKYGAGCVENTSHSSRH